MLTIFAVIVAAVVAGLVGVRMGRNMERRVRIAPPPPPPPPSVQEFGLNEAVLVLHFVKNTTTAADWQKVFQTVLFCVTKFLGFENVAPADAQAAVSRSRSAIDSRNKEISDLEDDAAGLKERVKRLRADNVREEATAESMQQLVALCVLEE